MDMSHIYYEVGEGGNTLGPREIECPECGNCAFGMTMLEIEIIIMFNNANQIVMDNIIMDNNDEDNVYFCPQCGVEMVDYRLIQEQHKEDGCPGCIICGNIEDNVFQICKECIINYGTTLIDCENCEYNYSRIQMGIDVNSLRLHYGLEFMEMHEHWTDEDQIELFDKPYRRRFQKDNECRRIYRAR